jgi:hypothetical protein
VGSFTVLPFEVTVFGSRRTPSVLASPEDLVDSTKALFGIRADFLVCFILFWASWACFAASQASLQACTLAAFLAFFSAVSCLRIKACKARALRSSSL